MQDSLFTPIEPLLPIDFFEIAAEIPYAKKRPSKAPSWLPDTTALLGEEHFADVGVSWNEEALFIDARVEKPFEEASYPNFSEGDALELFFDTRDLKSAGFATRFCHHFVILPKAVQGVQAQELTRFRTEDSHPLCDPSLIAVTSCFDKQSYTLSITFPKESLHGYDPAQCPRLGFTYRCHRHKGEAQHFSVSATFFPIEQHPRLWASLHLVNG